MYSVYSYQVYVLYGYLGMNVLYMFGIGGGSVGYG